MILFISFKNYDASSSDDPPDKKVTAGSAGTIVLDKVLTVIHAISLAFDLSGHDYPGVTIFGFNRRPSMSKCWLKSSAMTAEKTLSDTSALT